MNTNDFFNNVPQNIVIVAPDLKILAATDTYLRTTGRRREDILGQHFLLEAFPNNEVPYEENPVKKSIEKALQTKQVDFLDVIRYDIARSAEEGEGYSERYWEASHTPVLNADGTVEYVIQNTHDVTERELAKRAQEISEEKFKFLTDAVPQLIYMTDAAGNLTYVNQRWSDYTGLSLEESLRGTGWDQAIHPDDLKMLQEKLKRALADGSELQAEVRIRNRFGMYRWFLIKSLALKDEAGNVMLRVGSSSDIQETKQLVQELLESNEQMSVLADQVERAYQKAENRRQVLEAYINQTPAIFAILQGPKHEFEVVNPYYQKLFPHRELLGKPVAEAVPEVVAQGFIDVLDNVYNTGKAFVAEEILVRADWKDTGTLEDMYFTTTYQPLMEDGKVAGILVFGYDVSEKVRLRQELQALQQQ